VLDYLASEATFSANVAASAMPIDSPPSTYVRAGVRAALHALEANGWIKFTPPPFDQVTTFLVTPPEEDDA
jgi:hypothetical protein